MTTTAFDTKSGTTHLTEGQAQAARPNLALCGRTLAAWTTYGAESTGKLRDIHDRLSRTHQTGTCRRCFDSEATR